MTRPRVRSLAVAYGSAILALSPVGAAAQMAWPSTARELQTDHVRQVLDAAGYAVGAAVDGRGRPCHYP